jgi:glycerate dehydrogenase
MEDKIAVLDGYTMNPGDLDWGPLQRLGNVMLYDRTPVEDIIPRSQGASVLVVNKVPLDKHTLKQLPALRCICVTATGYNNIDIAAARELNIDVCNVAGYSTHSVAQHVFALLLELTNRVAEHSQSVHSGRWSNQADFSYSLSPIPELHGKTMGIYGFGRIGQAVGRIARAFGMEVLATHTHPERDARVGVSFVSLPALLRESDVLTLHAPLKEENRHLMNAERLQQMKSTAWLINTGRGGLVQQEDLAKALKEGWIAGAGLDVLEEEPPPSDHPLLGLSNCLITPHQAWASQEARQRLLQETVENVEAYLNGMPQHVVN